MKKIRRILTMMVFFILCILIIAGLIYAKGLSTGSYSGPISDHFDGKVFFNPGHYTKRSGLDIFRWWSSRHRQKWPAHVQNVAHSIITPVTQPQEIKITFVNHDTFLIQTQKLNLLTDPIWSYRASPFTWYGPARVRDPGMSFEELPKIDLVLITHNHYDHMDLATLIKLNDKFHPIFLVPLGDKHFLNRQGLQNVIEMDWWQQYQLNGTTITFLPTQHWSARWINDKYRTLWGSYGIALEHKKIYFAGDTGYSANFINIQKRWGTPDIAFLPIGAYMPLWFMHENHLNPEEAVRAHLDLQSHHSIAIHFGTFQLSDEAIDQPIKDLNTALIKHHLNHENFMVLNEGETKSF